MQIEQTHISINDLLELRRNKMLVANAEYQRGAVWSSVQQKKLIDSVLRGYPLPMIYLHHIKKTVAGMTREDFEIIDGQQRMNALSDFAEGAYKLFDPIADDAKARFPNFLKKEPCPWGRKDFPSLPKELKEQFLATPIAVAKISSGNENEVRDLFVRLQSGLPLNAQETRDAQPGQFTEYVLALGGKPELARYPGHEFFRRVMGMKPGADRGKTRALVAQIAMLFFGRRDGGPDAFTDINSAGINEFYYTHIDFDAKSPDAVRFIEILTKLEQLLGGGTLPKLRAHDVIHLILLIDTLWDDYTRSWESKLVPALDRFLAALAKAKLTADSAQPDEFWSQYGVWTRVNSDRGDRIKHRHAFYAAQMLKFVAPLQPKDPKRAYGPLEREIIYFRDEKKCALCKAPVSWNEVEIHHVLEHAKGGQTVMTNGALVHRHCHPKGSAAATFAAAQGLT